ncbi:hypothetical protein [Ekhidna sp.]|uniref:hypothetical protein n=1 Tax=Ekhidna sp. TaxID=2608089 RepID=UPI003CCBE7EE
MVEKIFSFFISLLIVLYAHAQSNYIDTDTSRLVGIDIIAGTPKENAQSIVVREGDAYKKFSPYDLTGYGLENGQHFKAFDIQSNSEIKRYFLKELVSGKLKIYYLILEDGKESYFISKNDSIIIKIPMATDEFVPLIKDCVRDCNQSVKDVSYLRLNQNSLKRFFNAYNGCTSIPLPRIRYGFKIGVSSAKFVSDYSSLPQLQSLPDRASYLIGFNVDVPVDVTNSSIHFGLLIKDYGSVYSFSNTQNEYDLIIDDISMEIPVLYRYTFLHSKFSPYIEIGSIYSRSLKSKNLLYTYKSIQNSVFIDKEKIALNNKLGYGIGAGFISDYSNKLSWYLNIRLSSLNSLVEDNFQFNLKERSISLGIIL